jgi:fructokinase
VIVGIETGGTKVVCAAGTGPTELRLMETFPTKEPEVTLGEIAAFLHRVREAEYIEAVGVGSFGPVDLDPRSATYGTIGASPKVAWRDVNLVESVRRAAGSPVAIETDVTAAALGELRWGVGVGLADLAYVTVGTGVGVGAIVHGLPLHGTAHPEAGHILVRRHPEDDFEGGCPLHGDCLEGLASGPAVAQRFGRPGKDLGHLLPRAVELGSYYVSQLVTSLVYVLSPAAIVLGGGVMATPGLLEAVRARTAEMLAGALGEHPASDPTSGFLSRPELGDRAGVVGALTLASDLAAAAAAELPPTGAEVAP